MNKTRVLAAVALTAGLGMAGVTTASASGAAGSTGSRVEYGTVAAAKAKGHGREVVVVCHAKRGPAKGAPAKTTVRLVDGKVYVNGKEVSKAGLKSKFKNSCGPLPVPPVAGKGGVFVCAVEGGGKGDGPVLKKPKAGSPKIVVKAVDGKIYVNGKQVPPAKLHPQGGGGSRCGASATDDNAARCGAGHREPGMIGETPPRARPRPPLRRRIVCHTSAAPSRLRDGPGHLLTEFPYTGGTFRRDGPSGG
ncbi:hypothetical protein [Streptomyces sp. NRRL S-813]|uniref:hypothetical protein n=1 Tax=Streptomyces sp. NRRL S-813 TaxID=1463919 RepID=UPI0004BF48B9|nr:hypothetical protein [Streptomyces sp. NRRL S-813]